jgi:hypothetical protein
MGANASNTSVQGLGEALSYAAPTAKSLGLSLESTVAIIGKFADAGIDASRAGTALNSILSQFSDPASNFRKELYAAGITTSNFEAALTQLAAAGPKGQQAILAVGTEAGPALRALLNQGIGALDELRGKLQGAQGSAAATAAVMRDNLNGSISSLSSTWDTLKNALATPVLPVLKSAVDSLSASFAEAVNSGVVTRFGEAISRGFESAITWGKAFLAQVDFEAMAAKFRAYADRAEESFDRIQQAAVNAGNVVQTTWGVMSAGANAVMTVVYAVGVGFAGLASQVQQGIALIYEGMAKITFGDISAQYKQLAADVRQSAEATYAAGYALATKTIESFGAMTESAQMARNGWAGLTGSVDESAVATATAQRVIDATATSLKAMGGDAQAAGQQAAVAATAQKEALEKTLTKVAELRAEYQVAVRTGAWEAAKKALEDLELASAVARVQIEKLAGGAKKAEDDVSAAFIAMGLKTKVQLEELAATAHKQFETIKNSGKATPDVIAAAWKKMAEAAIAANGGLATGTQKAQAAMYGLKIEADATGKSIVTAMDKGAGAAFRLAEAVQLTAAQIKANADAVDRLNMKYMQSSKYSENQIALLEKEVAAREKLNEVRKREIALENERRGVDAEGFSINRATGQRITQTVQTAAEIEAQLVAGGVDSGNAREYAARILRNQQVPSGIANFSGGEASRSTQQQITDLIREVGTRSAPTVGGVAKTYNVQVGGSTAKFDTDQEAQGFINQLKKAKFAS